MVPLWSLAQKDNVIKTKNYAIAVKAELGDFKLQSPIKERKTAVYSDMITWSYSKPVETAAFQLLHVMFSVPQISVRLQDIPLSHQKMLQCWMSFWNEHSNTLLEPDIQPLFPDKSYPIVYSSNEKKCIVGLYQSRFTVYFSGNNLNKNIAAMNLTATNKVTVNNLGSITAYCN